MAGVTPLDGCFAADITEQPCGLSCVYACDGTDGARPAIAVAVTAFVIDWFDFDRHLALQKVLLYTVILSYFRKKVNRVFTGYGWN